MYVLAAASHSRERRAENGEQARQVPRNGILKQVEERDSVSFKGWNTLVLRVTMKSHAKTSMGMPVLIHLLSR